LPDEAREATEAYREEMDVRGGFIAERCIVDPGCLRYCRGAL